MTVDKTGLDETLVDETGVDELGINIFVNLLHAHTHVIYYGCDIQTWLI